MSLITVGRVGRDDPNRINIRIDRSSPLGNPFYMADESMRDEVCDKYEAYLQREIRKKGSPVHVYLTHLYRLVRSGKAINLQCWCAPKRCHGDSIRKLLLKYLD